MKQINAIYLLARGWDTYVTEKTIGNCFQKGGFTHQTETDEDNSEEQTLLFPDNVDENLYKE